jgi:CRISPR-associated protein (Cas_Cas2CT1978)
MRRAGKGHVLQIWSTRSPQGFAYRQRGKSSRQLEDFDGIALVLTTQKPMGAGKMSEQKHP